MYICTRSVRATTRWPRRAHTTQCSTLERAADRIAGSERTVLRRRAPVRVRAASFLGVRVRV